MTQASSKRTIYPGAHSGWLFNTEEMAAMLANQIDVLAEAEPAAWWRNFKAIPMWAISAPTSTHGVFPIYAVHR